MTVTMPSASINDVMDTINSTLRDAGGMYSDYSCQTVSWDDVTRGEVGGALSCWGGNITDTRLYEKSGKQLYTVRSQNFNEKLGAISADELAIITGNQTPGGGPLTPLTLRDFLKGAGKHGSYAGLDAATDLSAAATDAKVSIRFMTTFLPVADEELATLEFAPEMYQYQTRTDEDPANLLVLATTQGVAVQSNGAGATKLYHHAVEPAAAPTQKPSICRYWFEAERSEKKVGGAQLESKEEALAAAKRGKATASVIGVRAMGTRFNVLMTIQVPLKQQPKPRRHVYGGGKGGKGGMPMLLSAMGGGMGGGKKKKCAGGKKKGGFGWGGGGGYSDSDDYEEEGFKTKSLSAYAMSEMMDSDEDDECFAEAPGGVMPQMVMACAMAPPVPAACAPMARSARRAPAAPPPPRVGKANAARVSRGSMVDKLDATVKVKTPVRDASQHVTVTVVIYNTVSGGVPSVADVRAAVEDMEALYASCGWKGRLADAGADFMKAELTVKDVLDISEKLKTQPYVPPAGEIGLVQGGSVFPSSGAA